MRIEAADLGLEVGDLAGADVGRIGRPGYRKGRRRPRAHRPPATAARSATPRRCALSRATSSAASLMSVPTPVAFGSSHSSVSSRQPEPGADVEDAQRRGMPSFRARRARARRRSASRCRAADRAWPARWRSCGRRTRARPGCATTGSRPRRAGRCSGASARPRSGLERPLGPAQQLRSRQAERRAPAAGAHRCRRPRCRRAAARASPRRRAARERAARGARAVVRHCRSRPWPPARSPGAR